MSRKTRRKTLSHAEIENFLCDLGNDSSDLMKTTAMETVTTVTEAITSSSDDENQITSSSTSIGNEEEDDKSYRARIVRAFHKDLITESNSTLASYAKIIHEKTQYPLLPKRQIYPEKYEHSITSLESKKALLMSMQPMLSAAEKQRKIDSEVLEEFTRCKVGKSRAKPSTYEYLDFDTNMRISGKEYSRRYMLCLAKKKETESGTDISASFSHSSVQSVSQQKTQPDKPSKSHLVLQDISDSFDNSNNSTSISSSPEKNPTKPVATASSTDLDFLMSFDDEDAGNVRKKDRSRGRHGIRSRREDNRGTISRRRTLSPASTKAILQQEIEDTINGETGERMEIAPQDNAEGVAQISVSDITMDIVEDEILTDESTEKDLRRSSSGKKRSLQSGGEAGLESLQSPCKVQLQSSSPVMQMLEGPEKETEQVATIDHFADLDNMDVPEAVKPLAQTIEKVESSDDVMMKEFLPENPRDDISKKQETSAFCEISSKEIMQVTSYSGAPEQEIDEETLEEKAYARYELRLEVAKWKYFWEMASEGAARVAAAKITSS